MGHVCALHIDNYVIPTPTRDIHLNKVLHVPSTSKNIASIHRLTYDNNVSIEFHHFSFFPSLEHSSSPRCVLSVNKPSISRWLGRLGHHSYAIVQKVLASNSL
jgi:hypothetical protein